MKYGIWEKIPDKRVEMIHNQTLGYKDEKGEWHYHNASKKTPIAGTVSARMYKKVGANLVEFYKFIPDFNQDICYELSSKWFHCNKADWSGCAEGTVYRMEHGTYFSWNDFCNKEEKDNE